MESFIIIGENKEEKDIKTLPAPNLYTVNLLSQFVRLLQFNHNRVTKRGNTFDGSKKIQVLALRAKNLCVRMSDSNLE